MAFPSECVNINVGENFVAMLHRCNAHSWRSAHFLFVYKDHFVQKNNPNKLQEWKKLQWSYFSRIQDIFEKVPKAKQGTPIEMSIRIVKELLSLDDKII